VHEYTAALRISGERLDITAITELLGLQPTHVVQVGEAQQGGPAKKAVWSFEIFPTGLSGWNSLENALVSLLRVLDPTFSHSATSTRF